MGGCIHWAYQMKYETKYVSYQQSRWINGSPSHAMYVKCSFCSVKQVETIIYGLLFKVRYLNSPCLRFFEYYSLSWVFKGMVKNELWRKRVSSVSFSGSVSCFALWKINFMREFLRSWVHGDKEVRQCPHLLSHWCATIFFFKIGLIGAFSPILHVLWFTARGSLVLCSNFCSIGMRQVVWWSFALGALYHFALNTNNQ